MFQVGDKVKFKESARDFWGRWFEESFEFDDIVTIKSVNSYEVRFKESRLYGAGVNDIEHAKGQMKLPFNWRK